MNKNEILKDLWEFIKADNFYKSKNKEQREKAKNNFFKKGMRKKKRRLEQFYNLYCYGYYNNNKYQLFLEIIDNINF